MESKESSPVVGSLRNSPSAGAGTKSESIGILSGRPRTPIYNSAEQYDLAFDLADASRRLSSAQTALGKFEEAQKTLKEGGIMEQLKKVTACEPYAGTRVSIGPRVESKKFKGYEVVVLDGPETRCNGVAIETTVKSQP